METQTILLKKRIKAATRLAVLGVGSEIRGDDIAGMLVASELDGVSADLNKTIPFKVFFGHTAPENLTGEIRRFKPSHLIIVDAAEMGIEPGGSKVFLPDEDLGVSFSTHKLPLKLMSDYIFKEMGCRVIMIGIQPLSTGFNAPVAEKVSEAVRKVTRMIKESIMDIKKGG